MAHSLLSPQTEETFETEETGLAPVDHEPPTRASCRNCSHTRALLLALGMAGTVVAMVLFGHSPAVQSAGVGDAVALPSNDKAPLCNGKNSGCTNIAEGDGDCDDDSDCAPGLKCGTDNCADFHDSTGWSGDHCQKFDTTDDCCYVKDDE